MDWKSLITELQGLGLSQAQIAKLCDCGQATISELATGKSNQPRFALGKALEDLLIRTRAEQQEA